MMEDLEQKLIEAMEVLNEDRLMEYATRLFHEGYNFFSMQNLLNKGVGRVGKLFESGEYFIADLMFSGVLYNQVLELYYQKFSAVEHPKLGTVMIAVMKNDIHDIGKNIICNVLRTEGFQVIDLGVDVDCHTIVEAVRAHKPDILALTGVMTYSRDEMKNTVDELVRQGLRDQVAVIIGGTCVNDDSKDEVGADACTRDPLKTVFFCQKTVVEKYD